MLKITESTTFSGKSVIDGVVAEEYKAVIDSNNPEGMTVTSWQVNKEVYKANRVQCRADNAEFEDMAYAKQDEMIAEKEIEE